MQKSQHLRWVERFQSPASVSLRPKCVHHVLLVIRVLARRYRCLQCECLNSSLPKRLRRRSGRVHPSTTLRVILSKRKNPASGVFSLYGAGGENRTPDSTLEVSCFTT